MGEAHAGLKGGSEDFAPDIAIAPHATTLMAPDSVTRIIVIGGGCHVGRRGM